MDDREVTVAAALKRARQAAGWSQRALAQHAGVHQPQVARAEAGEDLLVSVLARMALPLGLAPALVPTAAPAPTDPAPARGAAVAGAGHDTVDASAESWRVGWPQVDPQVFMVLARLTNAGRHVEAATRKTAAIHGMNAGELMVLGALRRKGAPYESTPTGLKHLLWLSLPGLKKRLDHLEAIGMVTRVSNPQDRRGLVVGLTARGHAALNDLVAHPQASVYRLLLEMPADDLASLSALLRGLLIRLESEGAGLP
ncbi:MAG TPA: helix-turn-helix domain-containing protein [Ramlibacter sp.]|nr:helix-turn-helix domain-containing protein [Ramlibacter sp.]